MDLMAACCHRTKAIARATLRPPPRGFFFAVDGDIYPNDLRGLPGAALVRGDSRCLEIACASIIAKVLRDRYMAQLSEAHTEFGWASNKGYATKTHIEAIAQHGLSPHHRPKPAQNALLHMQEKQTAAAGGGSD